MSRVAMTCAASVLLLLAGVNGYATIDGVTGTTFTLTARADHISTPDGRSILFWGYANGAGRAQYPGPTLILNQGDIITITLFNELDVPVSIIFPGQERVLSSPSAAPDGLLTKEAVPGGSVTYQFTATNAGTYLYQSGTTSDLQVEMGLFGAIIVRPYASAKYAYNHADSRFDRDYLLLLSEMDPRIHDLVESGGVGPLESTDYLSNYFPSYWFINGRNAPETMAASNVPHLPTQPYNAMPMMHPGDRVLMRVVNAGHDLHPFHVHGNHARIIGQQGRLLESSPGFGPDLSYSVFTIQVFPGNTLDAIFEWTGAGLGWDAYGHSPSDPLAPNEYAPDHGRPFPVILPDASALMFGTFFGGGPFLGVMGSLPPGGTNPEHGYAFLWHSHAERELVNFKSSPGGMMTMLLIVPDGVVIP